MWQRFTEKARRSVFFAQEEAGRRGVREVDTEHLLLGLIRESDSKSARILDEMGVSLGRIRKEVEQRIAQSKAVTRGDFQLTPSAKRVIDLAYDESRKLKHEYIGTEHLLLGLIREDEGMAGSVLRSLGAAIEPARRAVMELTEKNSEPRVRWTGRDIRDLVRQNRSYRRFNENEPISEEHLRSLVELARLSASAGNLQPLKYVLSNTPEKNALIFPTLAWAGYLKDWRGPKEGERPSAYIIILLDTAIKKESGCDHGIAAQSMLLGAVDMGFGGCMVGAVDRDQLRANLQIPEQYQILLVLALGQPTEGVVVEDVGPEGDIKYYRDEQDVHRVPKRTVDQIVLKI